MLKKKIEVPIIDVHIVKAMMKEKNITVKRVSGKIKGFPFFRIQVSQWRSSKFCQRRVLYFLASARCTPPSTSSCPKNLKKPNGNGFPSLPTNDTDFAHPHFIWCLTKKKSSLRLEKGLFFAVYSKFSLCFQRL